MATKENHALAAVDIALCKFGIVTGYKAVDIFFKGEFGVFKTGDAKVLELLFCKFSNLRISELQCFGKGKI